MVKVHVLYTNVLSNAVLACSGLANMQFAYHFSRRDKAHADAKPSFLLFYFKYDHPDSYSGAGAF